MPCPFFHPAAARTETEWFRSPRVPLGVLHSGTCQASPEPRQCDGVLCNTGYARQGCPSFPEDAPWDAVRFMLRSRTPEQIEVLYVYEAAHVPVEHGQLRYFPETAKLEGAESRPLLAAQARSFLAIALSAPEPAPSTSLASAPASRSRSRRALGS